MKKLILSSTLFMGLFTQAQTWQSVGFTGGFVNTADTFQNKLYIAGNGYVTYYDGSTWGELTNYNNSLNTPNKSKYAAKNIDGKLYMGADGFNTNGEGIVHVFDGTNITEKQGHRQFQYNGNKKIIDFVKANNNVIYLSDKFNIFEWRDTSTFWRNILPSPNIKSMFVFNGKLGYTTGNEVYFYDGTTLDSLGLSYFNIANGSLFGSVSRCVVKGNNLYLTGGFTKIIDVQTQQSETGGILKYDGTAKTLINANFAANPNPGTAARLNCIFVDDNNDIYVTANKDPNVNDVHLIKYNGTTWSDVDRLVEAGKGLYPQIPGSEIADYNIIFKHQNNIFIGGRFVTIGGDSIAALAKLTTGSTGTQEVTSRVLSCYPNPAQHTITLSGITTALDIVCFDALGKTVLELSKQYQQIDISQLPQGIYYLVGKDGQGQLYHSKFVKHE